MAWDRHEFWRRPEVDALMRERYAAGARASEVAELLNEGYCPPGHMTRNSVISRWHRIGLKRGLSHAQAAQLARSPRPKTPQPQQPKKRGIKMFGRCIGGNGRSNGRAPEVADNPDDIARIANLLDLEEHHCRFPVRRDGFCGDTKVSGLPYCEAHVRRCYRVPEKTANRTGRLNAVMSVLGSETTRQPLETVGNRS